MVDASASRSSWGSALVPSGFAVLALAGVLAVMGLSSAELENPDQAARWATAAFLVALTGALAVVVGAFARARGGA